MIADIFLLPGDGIGPEVTEAAVQVLQRAADLFGHTLRFSEGRIGGIAIDETGTALSDETLQACREADAVLLGAVGGPKWDDPLSEVRPEQGLLKLRKGLAVFANLRPVRTYPSLIGTSPIKPERLAGVDMLVIRELTGGLYFGQPKRQQVVGGRRQAVDTLSYDEDEIRRVVDLAFRLAGLRRKIVTSVDKANVLESSRLWRQVAIETGRLYPDIHLEHMLADTAAMRLVTSPGGFDVLVTENTFGDILTDEASVLAGSMGLLPSASLGDGGPGLFEPIHGSAPDIAGRGIANPIGAILSAALLLRHSLHLEQEAAAVEAAVVDVLESGSRTSDLGGKLTTNQMTGAILAKLAMDGILESKVDR